MQRNRKISCTLWREMLEDLRKCRYVSSPFIPSTTTSNIQQVDIIIVCKVCLLHPVGNSLSPALSSHLWQYCPIKKTLLTSLAHFPPLDISISHLLIFPISWYFPPLIITHLLMLSALKVLDTSTCSEIHPSQSIHLTYYLFLSFTYFFLSF